MLLRVCIALAAPPIREPASPRPCDACDVPVNGHGPVEPSESMMRRPRVHCRPPRSGRAYDPVSICGFRWPPSCLCHTGIGFGGGFRVLVLAGLRVGEEKGATALSEKGPVMMGENGPVQLVLSGPAGLAADEIFASCPLPWSFTSWPPSTPSLSGWGSPSISRDFFVTPLPRPRPFHTDIGY